MRFRPWRDIARRGTLCIIGGRGHIRLASRRGAEWTALLGSIGVLSLLAFTPLFGTPLLDFPYLLCLTLMWAAVRRGHAGSIAAAALILGIAIWGTSGGSGPFAQRTLHESLLAMLPFLGVMAVTLLILAAVVTERRHADAADREQREPFEVTLASIGDAVIATDTQGRVTFLNHLAVPILIGPRVEGLLYVSNPPALPFADQDEEILLRLAAHAAIAIRNAQIYRAAQEEITRRTRAEEQLTASLREKEVLLKEVHHRVKNNLQIISSLLDLQSDAIHDPQLRGRFRDSQDRIRSMALAHETLYRSRDLARFDVAPYIDTLSTQLFRSYGVDPQRIGLQTRLDRVSLDIDTAIPCGLILNELLTNAFKYAFPADQVGEVEVALSADAAQGVTLVVRDTGIGFPEGLDFRHTDSLGMQLVCLLTEQLDGTVALARQGGTTLTLTFPASAVSP